MSVVEESAVAAYGGCEYQIIVTVWVALDLVVAHEWCDGIDVEPASQEDIAANLVVPPAAAEAVETVVGAASNDGRIEIQIKRRSQFWSVSDFAKMVETPAKIGSRGPAPRERALTRLKADAQLRYLLITDAEVHPKLKDFVVDRIGCASKATDASIGGLSPGQAPRIGIREKRLQELVEREIDDILEQGARVPLQKVRDCRAALIERVRDRLLGRRGARLDRMELEELIALHGGFPPSGSDEFVPPAGFDDLRRLLGEPPFALVLLGPPGIGKTLAAEKLVEEFRRAARPFEIMKNPEPHEIRAKLMQPGRTIFYLEDPWGGYKLAEDAAMWSDELPRLIRRANANSDKRFLVTSRTGVLRESIDLSPQGREPKSLQHKLTASVVSIVEADFDEQARNKIVRLWMRGAARWQRDWVEDRLKDVVAELTVPQALSVFAHAVKSSQNATDLQLSRLLAESQVAAIGDMVRRQVRELRAVAAAVTLWAFLSVGERLTHALMKELATWICEVAPDGADLPRVAEHLAANGWLTISEGLVTAHPTVIEGLERLVDEEKTSCHRVLQDLFSVLVRKGRVEMVTRLLRGLSGRNMPIPPIVRTAIEQHLLSSVLNADDSHLGPAMVALARISKATDPISLLVRALGARTEKHGFVDWIPPAWTTAEQTAVTRSAEAERLVRWYIKAGLSSNDPLFPEEVLVEFLWTLGWDLSGDFESAAVTALRRGGGADGAIHGALKAPAPAWDRLLSVALDEYDDADSWFAETGSKDQRRAHEGELDAAYSAHVIDEPSERFAPSMNAIQKIVAARRAQGGYGWLNNHPRRHALVRGWAESIPYDSGESVRDELRALLLASEGYNRPDVWQAIGRSRCLSLTALLQHGLTQGPVVELGAMWGALFGLYAPEKLEDVVGPLVASAEWPRRAAMVFAVRDARMPDRHDHVHRGVDDHQRRVRSLLAPNDRAALEVCSDVLASGDIPASVSGIDTRLLGTIAAIAEGEHPLLAAGACVVLAYHGRAERAQISRLLASDDKWVRLHALRAIGLMKPLDRATLSQALKDPYYQCRRFAMFELSEDASPEDRTRITAMAADASAPVREACARIIGEQRWSDGAESLRILLKDNRDRDEGGAFNDGSPDFHVAREAARALRRIPRPLPGPIVASLLQFLQKGRDECADIVVHSELLDVVDGYRVPALAPLIQRLLRSSWRMGGEKGSFPLRYAAAWSWVDHLLKFGEDAPLIPSAVLVEAAEHTDGRLAAPVLLALGIAWKDAAEHVRQLLAGPDLSDERRLLVEVGARLAGGSLPENILQPHLSPLHPGRRLVAWCWDAAEVDEAWRSRIDADAELQCWLENIRVSSPVTAALRAALLRSPRKDLLTMISRDDFRSNELTTGTRILSSFHLAGLE